MYLGGRWSIPINSNPYLSISDDIIPGSQTERCAKLVVGKVRWWRDLIANKMSMREVREKDKVSK